MSEFAPGSKSADEIRGLRQWIEAKLSIATAAEQSAQLIREPADASVPAVSIETPAETAALVS